MKILLTGASSFTGSWIAETLAKAGHQVTVTMQRSKEDYKGIQSKRIVNIERSCDLVYDCPFGSEKFLNTVLKLPKLDLLCHHAAQATNYKSQDFDVYGALKNNTEKIQDVLQCLEKVGCSHLCITGSVFEDQEGAGSDQLRVFSPYGLSKSFTAQLIKYHCRQRGFCLGKFVIPNPFGPFEDAKLSHYLASTWLSSKIPVIETPHYVRDNIPVNLMALAYNDFVTKLRSKTDAGFHKLNPSAYAETNDAFAFRMASEMEKRWGRCCDFMGKQGATYTEPMVRINTDVLDQQSLGWDEEKFWTGLAAYYMNLSKRSLL